MRKLFQLFLVVVVAFSLLMIYNLLREAHWELEWWKALILILPDAGTVIAIIELSHSAEANESRRERNRLATANNELEDQRNNLAEENNGLQRQLQDLQAERNEHLAEIARQMQRPQTVAEKNATKLRQHLGTPAVIFNPDNSRWPTAPRIAEVSDSNIVALFQPMQQGSQAWVTYADCGEIELVEIAEGACPLRIKVNKRYGNIVQLGEIANWEDRMTPAAAPKFEGPELAHRAEYAKSGSPEIRRLFIHASTVAPDSYLLEASTGERFVGDHIEISKRFQCLKVEYRAAGFIEKVAGDGVRPHPLYVW